MCAKIPTGWLEIQSEQKMCVVCGACVRKKKKRQSSKTVPLQNSNALHMWVETLQCSYNCEEQKERHVRVTEKTAFNMLDQHN